MIRAAHYLLNLCQYVKCLIIMQVDKALIKKCTVLIHLLYGFDTTRTKAYGKRRISCEW